MRVLTFTSSIVCAHRQTDRSHAQPRTAMVANLSEGIYALETAEKALRHDSQ